MVIKELYVDNFGRLSSFGYKFTEGLNCIIKDNGFGKTTLAAFIKAMLYGLDDNRKQSLLENMRKRYTPWQEGRFGGWLIYEAGGKKYKIERSFGAKASADTLTLTDLKTGLAVPAPSVSIGEMLFDIDEEGFERTVFLSERNIYQGGAPDTVSAKLSGITGIEGDIGGFDAAIELLDKRRKIYCKRGGAGAIKDAEEEVGEIFARLKNASDGEAAALAYVAAAKSAEEKIKVLKATHSSLTKELTKFSEGAARAAYAEEYAIKKARLAKEEEKLKEYEKFFEKGIPAAKEIAEKESQAKEAADIRCSIKETGERNSVPCPFKRVPDEEEIARYSYTVSGVKRGKTVSPALRGILLLGTLVSAVIGLFIPYLFILTAVLGIICSVCFKISQDAKNNEKDSSQVSDFIEEVYGEARIGEPLSLLISMRAELENYRGQIEARDAQIKERSRCREEACEKAARLDISVDEFISKYPTKTDTPFEEIRNALYAYSAQRTFVNGLREECSDFAGRHNISAEDNFAMDRERIEEVKRELEITDGKISELEKEKLLAENSASRIALEAELANAEEKAALYRNNYSVITKTAELLALAKTNMTARYLDKTREKFKEITAYIDGVGGEFTVDTSFSIKKTEGGASRECEAYSRGTRELYLLALRIAITLSLYEKDFPPIILDDPFIAFDDNNAGRAMELLSKLGKDMQIIYFSCSKSRS